MRNPALPLAVSVVSLLAIIAVSGCSSAGTTTQEKAPEQDKGLDPTGGAAVDTTGKNPDGVPYPSTGIGTTSGTHKATAVGKPGDRIANFKFVGYINGDKAGGLKPFSMADYYDPKAKTIKLIHIQAAGIWCGYCKLESQLIAPIADEMKAKGMILLTTVAEGKTGGTPAVLADLDAWLGIAQNPKYTIALDPGNKNLGVFYTAAALPWNAWVDPRTMEILEAHEGGYAQGTTSDKVRQDFDSWLNFVNNIYKPSGT